MGQSGSQYLYYCIQGGTPEINTSFGSSGIKVYLQQEIKMDRPTILFDGLPDFVP